MKGKQSAFTSSFILPPSSFLSVVPVFGDELDGERFAVGGALLVALPRVCDEHLFGALARAAGEAAGLDRGRVGNEAYRAQVVGVQLQGLVGRLDAERDAHVVALYRDEPAARLLALEAEPLVLRPAAQGHVAGLHVQG